MGVVDLEERRKTGRVSVLETGLIRFGDTSTCCAIRSLSPIGASLDVPPQAKIPDTFTLISINAQKIHSCTIVWRKNGRIGVVFN
jgi:hypothetical protein